jgi:hypothetical protein
LAKGNSRSSNFQSSIENELQAELITGKQLNLERARAAALMGDQVAVAEELAAQGMTSTEFSKMNVIAQNSYAKALGTTSNELADQLKKREVALASGKSLAQITADEADEATKRQDVQTKFNAGMEKLQSLIGNLLAGPLGSFLEMLAGGLDLINKMITPLIVIDDSATFVAKIIRRVYCCPWSSKIFLYKSALIDNSRIPLSALASNISINGFSSLLFFLFNVLIFLDNSSLIKFPSAPDFTNIKISPKSLVFKICSDLLKDANLQSGTGFGSKKISTLNSNFPGISIS